MFELSQTVFGALRRQSLSAALSESLRREGFRTKASSDFRELQVVDACSRTTRFFFGDRGFVERIVSPLGRQTAITTDDNGALVSLVTIEGTKLGLDHTPHGGAVSVNGTPVVTVESDEHHLTTVYKYPDGTSAEVVVDPAGRPKFRRDRVGNQESFEHDGRGRLVGIRDGNRNLTKIAYKGEEIPFTVTYPDGTNERLEPKDGALCASAAGTPWFTLKVDPASGNQNAEFPDGDAFTLLHDAPGRLEKAISPEHCSSYARDGHGRVIEEQNDEDRITYGYDDSGVLAAMTYPGGRGIRFDYDADLRLEELSDSEGGVCKFSYDSARATITQRFPTGMTSVLTLGPTGRLLSQVWVSPAGRSITVLRYGYDAEGRLTSFEDAATGNAKAGYDAAGRLTQYEGGDGKTERFAYDGAGNRTLAAAGEAKFNALNQLTEQGQTRCDYDERGHVVRIVGGGRDWSYGHNARGQMVRASRVGGTAIELGYDPFGRRAWKRTATEQVTYVWAGENLIRETHSDGQTSESQDYVYLPGSVVPAATTFRGETYYYITDHLGRPVHLLDGAGAMVWSARYTGFGEAKILLDSIPNNFRAPGQYFDPETGLHYNRFRYYSPELGRYLSRDPLSYMAGTNLYAYVGNDPINECDPLGLFSWKTAVSIGAGIAAGAAIVLLAPVSVPALAVILASGAVAGAVGFGVNEGLNEKKFCFKCILKEAGRGALIGAAAAAPFILLPATAGVLAYAGVGAGSGAIGYMGDYLTGSGATWNWGDFGMAVGIGAATAGLGRYVLPKLFPRVPKEVPPVEETAPEWNGPTDYSGISDPKNVGASTKPTPRQVAQMKAANRANNDGVLRSDLSGAEMVDSGKSQRGVTPPSNEAQVDHITSVDKGGTRTQSNLQLLTRQENRAKSNK